MKLSHLTLEQARGFADYYNNQSSNYPQNPGRYSPPFKSPPPGIVSNLSSGKTYKNVNSRQLTNFQNGPLFPLFTSNSTCNTFPISPLQILPSTLPDYSRGERYHKPVSILDGVTSGTIFRNGNSGQSTNFQDRPCFPLFATTPRPQSSQSLYYLKSTLSSNENSDPYSRGEWGRMMLKQSLLDQISSGRIFVGNFHQNQTEIQCHHLYKGTPNSYTALSSNGSVIHSFSKDSLEYRPQNRLPSSNMNPKNTHPSRYNIETCLV